MKVMQTTTAMALAALLAAACSSSSGGSGQGPIGAVGSNDLGSLPGDVQAVPDGVDVPVVPETECDSERPCADGKICDCEGACVEDPDTKECTEDKNCGIPNYCDTCIGRCRQQVDLCEPCAADQQCKGKNSRCLVYVSGDSYCGKACEDDPGCPSNFECKAIGAIKKKQCVPRTADCVQQVACTKDAECKLGFYCNKDVGECAKGCADDVECPDEKICSALRCQLACDDTTNPCPEDFICEEGRCKVEGGCLVPQDCPIPETYCDEETKMCQPGCAQDFDCKASGKACVDGECVEKPCPGNFWCAYLQVCDRSSGKCEPAEGPFCDVCDPEGDQAQHEAQCGTGGICATVQDEEGNEKGSFCLPACLPGRTDRCPKGFQCMEVKDQDGNLVTEVCQRDCSYDPLGKKEEETPPEETPPEETPPEETPPQ